MSNSGVTLGELIRLKGADITTVLQDHLKDNGAGAGIASSVLGLAADEGAEKLCAALDADVFELIAHAWAKIKELEEYKDPKKHPPGVVEIKTLGKHDVTKTEEPVLELEYGELKLPALRFSVDLTVRFSSLALSISDGAIRSVAPGKVTAVACLRYKSVKLTPEKESEPLNLPGQIKFDKPILI